MFHRIYESMELGMHPASIYPRRSRIAPTRRVLRGPHGHEHIQHAFNTQYQFYIPHPVRAHLAQTQTRIAGFMGRGSFRSALFIYSCARQFAPNVLYRFNLSRYNSFIRRHGRER